MRSDRHPGNSLPTDVQVLRERVPSSLFPAITDTLQLNGSHEVYRASLDTSGEHFRLQNPQHSLSAELGSDGVNISSAKSAERTWSLKFDGYGRGTSIDHVAAPSLTAEGSRVEYQYPAGVTEWYVNGPLGLQQGFTFESKPSIQIEGPLVVRLTMSGDVTVEVNESGTSALLRSRESSDALKYGGLYAYDASGVELGARLHATSGGLSILVDDASALYPITIDPFIEKHHLSGSANDPREEFGISVSVSGDTVVVGAPSVHWGNTWGAAYVFTVPEGGQTSVPGSVLLTSPRAMDGDIFGSSVSISGDTIVVGAPGENPEEPDDWVLDGAAYVFTRPSGGWASTSDAARLTAPDDASVTWFGTSVAVSGDTVVVGAPGHRYRTWEESQRAAYVFTKPNEGWSDTSDAVELTAPDGSIDDKFGHSVAVSGDTVVVGAYLADPESNEEDFGAAYVFTRPSQGWMDTSDAVKLTAPDGAKGREFGWSVSVSGDTLVIGAPYTGEFIDYETYREEDAAEDKTPFLGSAYVYTRGDSGWADASGPAKLTASDGIPWTQFGWSVSVRGDMVVVGAPGVRWSLEHAGAYVFTRPSGGWRSGSEQRELPGLDNEPRSFFGSSVYAGADIVVVGASDDDNENGPDAGSAFVYRMPTDGWASNSPIADSAMLTAFDGPFGDRFGHSVAVQGETLVVGVPGNHQTERGRANVFVRRGDDWDRFRILAASDAAPGARFGSSVAVSENTFVVGAPGTGNGNAPGAAYVFARPDDRWGRDYEVPYTARLTIPHGRVGGRFGHSVAASGDTIVVGAPGEGAVYVYTRPDAGWAQVSAPARLTAPGDTAGRWFGHAVSITGDTIVVGAPGGSGAGVAYIFTRPDAGWADTSAAAELTASEAVTGDRFGYAVSLRGSTLLVGAPGNESGEGLGAAYVFAKPSTGWSNTSTAARLNASDGAAGDWFGHSVSVSDAFIVVGAHGGQENSGAVYAFRRPEGVWTTSSDAHKVTAEEGAPGDTFGYSVSVSGDVLAVGVPSAVGSPSGLARVFTWPGLLWVDTPAAFKVIPPNAESSRVFGASLSADGNTVVLGTVQADDTATSSVATAKTFVYTRQDGEWDTSAPATLILPDGGTFSQSGLAVSENGDTVVVGFTPAASASDTAPDPNSVLVFTRPDGGWASTSSAARLTMQDGESEGSFGRAVSVSGDTVVVGAYGDDSRKGSAFVFTRPHGGWVSTSVAARLTAPAGDPGDEFGRAVAVSGDTVVIAAPGDRDIRGYDAGSAYVFTRPTEGWISTFESARLTAPDGWSVYWSRNDFGSSVAVKGDKIVIGAPSWDVNSAAYVFTKPPGGWDSPYIVSKLTSPGLASYSNFGTSVSMSDDAIFVGAPGGRYADNSGQVFAFPIPADTDVFTGVPVRLSDPHGGTLDAFGGVVSAGGNSVAVGALLSDDHGEDLGAVYVFSEPRDGWDYSTGPMGHTATLVSPDWNRGHLFGRSISPTSDAVTVGAPNSNGASGPGAAYVFTGPFDSLFSRDDAAKLSPPGGDAGRSFGWSVSLISDALAVGSPELTSGTGAAYVFNRPDEGWVSTLDAAKLTSPRNGSDRNFGYSVSLSGGTVVVGAIRDDEAAGSAYLFTKPRSGNWQSTSDAIELNAPEGEGLGTFGWSVAITDDTLAVGMPSMEGLGSVYVFTRPTGGWASVAAPVKLTPSDGRNGDMFGASVAVSGDTVVVGASGNGNYDLPGAVYVFTKPATGWASMSEAAKLTPENGESGDWFGTSVAVDGDTVVVGGQNYNGYHQTNDAYVFSKPSGGWVSASAPPINVYVNRYGYSEQRLGVSVGVAGDSVFVGTPSGTGIGTVYAYEDFFDE